MPFLRFLSIFFLLLLIPLSGCYNKSQRYLASDAGLIRAGSSTRNDVLTYLGEPDRQRTLEDGREEWVYVEEKPSGLQRMPFFGSFFSGNGYDKIFVLFKDEIVLSCQFREFDENEFDWTDNYSWQEKTE